MIVASGAADREAQEGHASRRDHVVELVIPGRLEFGLGQLGRERAGAQEPGRGHGHRVIGRQLVARELPVDELVVRHVAVEGTDQEVAIVVSEGPIVVLLVAMRLGEPRHVHPVTGESFSVIGRRQQAIDEALVGVGGRVVDEGVDLLGRGGQSRQVEGDAADQGAPVGDRIRLQPATLERGEDEPVDGRANPGRILHRGRRDDGQRPERPEVLVGLSGACCHPRRGGPIDERPVIGGTQVDPSGDLGDRRIGELRGLLGHVRIVFMPDQHGEPALLAASFEHAAIDQRLAVREVEPAFLRLAAVAVETVLDERRADLRLEQVEALLHFLGMVGRYTTRRVVGLERRHQIDQGEDQDGEAGPDSESHGGCFGSYPDGGLNAVGRFLSYRAEVSPAIRAVETFGSRRLRPAVLHVTGHESTV